MITNLKCVKRKPGRLDAGIWIKPSWHMEFTKDNQPRSVPVIHTGENDRPLGQDCINAMKPYIKRKEITETAVLDAKIVD